MKSKGNSQLFNRARNYAFRLLKFRMRSEKELCQRLKRKKFDADIIERVIVFLREKGFINDREFSRTWVEYKIKRPLGIRRIKQELKVKGIDRKIIDEVLSGTLINYDEDSIVLELAKSRLERLGGLEPKKVRTRLYSYLLRRGFSPDVISDTINQITPERMER